jgi:steroid delta-isomerase-like uncharacterized protein
MTRDEIVALFERRNEHWNRHDAAAVAALHEDDAVAESPISGRLVGRRSIEHAYAIWMDAFPDNAIVTDEIVIDGDRVAQFFTLTGTQTGAFGGMPATGRKMQITGVFLATLSPNGRIARDRRLYDVTNMLVQIGALRTKPAN